MPSISKIIKTADNIISKFNDMPYIFPFLIFSTVFVLHVPIEYLFQSPAIYTNTVFAAEAFKSFPIINNYLLVAHIAAAIPAIIIAPFLFIPNLRKSYPKWHAWLGTIYVFGCIISAITVVPLAINNHPETIAPYGFTPMAILWFTTTYFAYTAAINKNYIAHRRWMLRSYAMTFAFVHVNMTWKLLLPYEEMSIGTMKTMQSMVSWLLNLFIIEIYLSATSFKGKFLGFKKWKNNLTKYSKDEKFYLNWKRPINNKKSKQT